MDDPSRPHERPSGWQGPDAPGDPGAVFPSYQPQRTPPPDAGYQDPPQPIGPAAPASGVFAEGGARIGATPGSAPPPAKQRRRWPWVLALVVVLAAAGLAAGVALDQRETALQWQERAVALEAQRDDAMDRGDELEGQFDELVAVVEASESDVAMLEERIRQLADEKAQAEDAATTVQVERDVVVDLTNDIAAATDSLDACVDRLFDLQAASVEAFNQSAAGDPVDVEPLNAQARETTSFCNDARAAAARASAAAQQLTP